MKSTLTTLTVALFVLFIGTASANGNNGNGHHHDNEGGAGGNAVIKDNTVTGGNAVIKDNVLKGGKGGDASAYAGVKHSGNSYNKLLQLDFDHTSQEQSQGMYGYQGQYGHQEAIGSGNTTEVSTDVDTVVKGDKHYSYNLGANAPAIAHGECAEGNSWSFLGIVSGGRTREGRWCITEQQLTWLKDNQWLVTGVGLDKKAIHPGVLRMARARACGYKKWRKPLAFAGIDCKKYNSRGDARRMITAEESTTDTAAVESTTVEVRAFADR